ncbi:NUDIX hydrolase [Mycolicibacterium aubagnense]|uniref:NUDIX hydrolase n=1 Tax=Mycolicibacterium aubagnense TaxID=319707 RepID=A0ABN5Z3J1_9MYCO|nr:NUDIX domain-containing protein [Mycolicibacterium aubagnense]TLH64305.1 NUDIX hydrolase [Mycolicibacterium aubagnense]BBX87960.1 NUDIX hydrolase [Mycolicibacterium aubagnense]
MTSSPRHSVSVAGVVVDDAGRVLTICRRDNGRWEAPGGVLELGESFEDGVRREVFEETGLQVEVQQLTGVYKNVSRGIVALVFRCRPAAGSARPTAEARDVIWMDADQVDTMMAPAFAIRVLDALDGGVHTRTHDGTNLVAP